MDLASRNPESGTAVGLGLGDRLADARVGDPLDPAVRNPTWPAVSSSTCTICGVKTPTCWTSKTFRST